MISRIVEPTSIMDTGRVLTDLGQSPVNERTMRRCLARAQQRGYRDQVATVCFNHAVANSDVSLCLYDVTTLYFEAEKEDPDVGGKDGLRKVGYSKERRVHPTGAGSRWRSAATKATRQRRPRSSRSSSSSKTVTA